MSLALSAESPPSGRKLRTRTAIVEAAGKVLAARGLSDMTVEHILAEAGVARATFYAHFTDKNEVTWAVVGQMWRRTSDQYATFAALPAADRPAVAAWLRRFQASWRVHQEEILALLRDMPVEITQASVEHMEEFVHQLVGDGGHWRCGLEEARRRAHLLIGQLERAMLDAYRGAWQVDDKLMIQALTTFWMAALQAPPED